MAGTTKLDLAFPTASNKPTFSLKTLSLFGPHGAWLNPQCKLLFPRALDGRRENAGLCQHTAKRHKQGSYIQSDRRFRATRSINSRMGHSDNRPEDSPATTRRTRWTSMVTCGTKVLHHSFNFVSLVCCALPSSKNQFTTSLLSVSSRVQSGFVLSSATTKIYSQASVFASTPTQIAAWSWVRKGPEKCKARTPGQCHCTQAAMMRLYPVSNLPLRYACPPCLVVVRGRAATPRLLVVV